MYKKLEILNKVGWWIVKKTCKHESKRLISFDHLERLYHQQCNMCCKEIWEED